MMKFCQQSLRIFKTLLRAAIITVQRLLVRKTAPRRYASNTLRAGFPRPRLRKNTQRLSESPKVRLVISAIVLLWLVAGLWHAQNFATNANPMQAIVPPLSTKGSQIVDRTGRQVFLRGVNWFGLETQTHAPHGLWKRDYKEMLAQIKNLGYNSIRLPYSVQALRDKKVEGIDFKIGVNKDLKGKTPLEVMDIIVKEAERQGLLIVLDSHRLNNQRIPELWYGDGFTEEDWIDTWKLLANRYKNQANIIGADLKNEPHGRASWGTGDRATDWRLAAERAGNAILAINPDWLIIVEGVEKNVPGQRLAIHWMGGNLEGVRRFPVRLSMRNKLVYSPHEYGPGVFNQPWFSEPSFPKNLYQRWEIGFNYIAREGIAPVWIGEFGGRKVDETSKEGIWQRQLVHFIEDQKLSFAYWSWNPNSGDTGGILLDNWLDIDETKQKLLNKLLPEAGNLPKPSPTRSPNLTQPSPEVTPLRSPRSEPSPEVTPTPSPTIPPTPTITPNYPRDSSPEARLNSAPRRQSNSEITYNLPTSSRRNLRVETQMDSNWEAGFCVRMRVTNQGNSRVQNWQMRFRMNEATINNSWNGDFIRQGSRYLVNPPDWARAIEPNQSVDMGFCANKQGSDYQPSQVSVN